MSKTALTLRLAALAMLAAPLPALAKADEAAPSAPAAVAGETRDGAGAMVEDELARNVRARQQPQQASQGQWLFRNWSLNFFRIISR